MLTLQPSELFERIRTGNLEKVRDLLHKDPSLVNAKTKSGSTAIMYALYNGQRQIAELVASMKEPDIYESASLVRELTG